MRITLCSKRKTSPNTRASISTLEHYPTSTLRRRLLRSAFLTFTALLFLTCLHAQRRTQDTSWTSTGPLRWLQVEKSVGVVPEIDFVNGGMGISICRGKFIRGTQRAMAGNGYYAGVSYDTDHSVTSANFGWWLGFFKRKFGGQIAARGMYYLAKQEQVFALRPEAGIGFPKMQLSYGYNFYTEKTEMHLPSHTLTLYVYFAVHSSRTGMY